MPKETKNINARYEPGLSFSQYRQIGMHENDKGVLVVNATTLKKRTAVEMKAVIDGGEEKYSRALVLGDIVHRAVLEPKGFEDDENNSWVLCPTKGLDTVKARGLRELYPEKIVVTQELVDTAKMIRDQVLKNDRCREILESCENRELTGICPDPDLGLVRKIRIDATTGTGDPEQSKMWAPFLVDLKTCRAQSFHLDHWSREAARLGYHVQFGFYWETDALITGRGKRDHFYVILAMNEPPFLTRLVEIDRTSLEAGVEIAKDRMGRLADAWVNNEFFGYEHETEIPLVNIVPARR